jgi:hypothetical protein
LGSGDFLIRGTTIEVPWLARKTEDQKPKLL